MSSAGTYNYWPKVVNPHAILPQMESLEYQPAFYFGASQVPINLHIATGQGFRSPYINHKGLSSVIPLRKRGIDTTASKHHNIRIPHTHKRI